MSNMEGQTWRLKRIDIPICAPAKGTAAGKKNTAKGGENWRIRKNPDLTLDVVPVTVSLALAFADSAGDDGLLYEPARLLCGGTSTQRALHHD